MNKEFNKENPYIEFKEVYREEDYFDIIELGVYYYSNNGLNKRPYKITRVDILNKDKVTSPRLSVLEGYIKSWNESIKNEKYPNDWQLFYLYKEIFQKLIHNKDVKQCYNYFRGQSDSRYELIPSAFRSNVKKDFLRDFEGIYEELARLFPNRLTYHELSKQKIKDRETQLSLLQHFGLKTTLLDITSNPFVAMLFMLSENIDNYKEPTLYFFQLDKYADKSKIFVEVVKNEWNERIIAQRGAFLNFDWAILPSENIEQDMDAKIPTIKLVLKFDEKELQETLQASIQSLLDIGLSEDDAIEFVSPLENEYAKDNLKSMDLIKKELMEKLHEYFYSEVDLFPDFEKRIQYISSQYNLDLNKQLNIESK